MVLAAGKGVRMLPLTKEKPKALLPTLDVTQLGWAVARLADAGVDRVWINAHDGAAHITGESERVASSLGLTLNLSLEEEMPLGTAGAIGKIAPVLTETFVVINADVVTDFGLASLIAAHAASGAEATVVGVPTQEDADFGAEEGWVVELVDRRSSLRPGHRYGGIAAFEPSILDHIPEGASGIYETVFAGMVGRKQGIAVFEWDGYWLDCGTPRAHLQANLDALSMRFDTSVTDLLRPGPIRSDPVAFVGAGARVADAEFRHSVVGRGAEIEAGTRLERCVVWDGARVRQGEYKDAILTPSRVVRAG